MERSHLFFIIARVNWRYRRLASALIGKIEPEDVVERSYHTISILEAPSNHVPIREELKAAERREEAFWTRPIPRCDVNHPGLPEADFPFIMTCLILGATYGLLDPSINNSRFEVEHVAGGLPRQAADHYGTFFESTRRHPPIIA